MFRIVAVRGQNLLTDVTLDQLPGLLGDVTVNLWVDLSGSPEDTLKQIVAKMFGFHPLAIEDCFEDLGRPKIEAYDGYVYVVTHGLSRGSTAEENEVVELDAFLSRRYLVTYHEKDSRSVELAWQSVLRSGEPLRRSPVGMLQSILDRQVDGIEPVLDSIEERIGEMEDHVLMRAHPEDLMRLMGLRRNTLTLRRWIALQRDVVLRLARSEFDFVSPHEALLFRDTHDHLSRFSELLETYRELVTSLQEAYLSVVNNRLSETMKFLTVFTAVLMPLTVLTGIFGMNFEFMPGLKSPLGFPVFMGVMALTSAGALWFAWRKGWLGRRGWNEFSSELPASTSAPPGSDFPR
jgi:magnesium transporter